MKPLGQVAARGAGVTIAAQGVRFLLQFGSLVVLARLLSPTDFGLVAMVTAVVGVAEIIRDFGLSSAAIQAKELNDDERTNLFWVNVGIGAACAVVAVAASPLIVHFYGQPQVGPIVLALSWLFIVSGINTQFRAELSRSLRFKALAATDVLAQTAGIAVAITAAFLGAGYWAIVGQQAVFVVLTCVSNVMFCRWRPGLPKRSVSIARFFRFGGGVLGTQIIGYATNNLDNVGIGAVWGAGPLGLYSRAYQLLMVPLNQINAPLTRVVLPVLARVQDDPVTYARYLKRIQLVGCYLLAILFAAAAGLSVPLVRVLFGAQWGGVAPIFAILAVGGVFRGIGQITYWIYLSRGLTGAQLKMYLWTRPLMIGLILAGLPWGPIGVAAGHTLAFLLYWLVSLWDVGRVAKLDVRPLLWQAVRSILMISGPVGLAAWAGTLLTRETALQVVFGLSFAAVWIVLVSVLSPPERDDAQTVMRLMGASLTRRRKKRGRHSAPRSKRGALVSSADRA